MIDPLWPLLLVLRYMHILGAIIMMGGAIYIRFILMDASQFLPGDQRAELLSAAKRKWSRWVMLGTALLLLSGLTNMGLASRQEFSGLATSAQYNMLLGIKLILALPIFFVAALLSGKSALAQKIEQKSTFWLNVCLVLALIMVLMGGYLRFVSRQLKSSPGATSTATAPMVGKSLEFFR